VSETLGSRGLDVLFADSSTDLSTEIVDNLKIIDK
jgi:hypothetical protein